VCCQEVHEWFENEVTAGKEAAEASRINRRKQMSDKSKIEWTDATWSTQHGCDKVDPTCKGCYACNFAERFRGVPGNAFEQGFDFRLVPGNLELPLHWKRPRKVFVNSMSDTFHEDAPDKYIVRVAEVMAEADWHTYQVLTKRSERMRDLLNSQLKFVARLPHIWWGVSCGNQKHGLPRIAHLQAARVAVRFLSLEPIIEDLGELDLSGISWAIIGGESGHGARPFQVDWARDLIQQCHRQHVACFVKQLGHNPVVDSNPFKLYSRKGGDPSEWPEDIRIREFPS
jgi:protein gp37